MPPAFARTFSTSQMSPNCTMRPLRDGVMSVVNILTRRVPGLHRLGDLRVDVGRQSCPAASCGRRSRRSMAPAHCCCRCSIACCTVMPPSTGAKSIVVVVPPNSAAWLTREAGSVSLASPSGHRHRPVAMDMRVDAAGDDDLPGGVDRCGRRRARRGCPARRSRRSFRPAMPISACSAPEGRTARPPVITVSSMRRLPLFVHRSLQRGRMRRSESAARRRRNARGFRRARCRGR